MALAPLALFFFVINGSSDEYILNRRSSYFRVVIQNKEHCLYLLAARLLVELDVVLLAVEQLVELVEPLVELVEPPVGLVELFAEPVGELSALFLFREAL